MTAPGIIETPVKNLNKIEVANIKVENLPVVIHKIPESSSENTSRNELRRKS